METFFHTRVEFPALTHNIGVFTYMISIQRSPKWEFFPYKVKGQGPRWHSTPPSKNYSSAPLPTTPYPSQGLQVLSRLYYHPIYVHYLTPESNGCTTVQGPAVLFRQKPDMILPT